MNEPAKNKPKVSKLDGPAATASSASGITLLLNYFLPMSYQMTPEEAQGVMTITPIFGGTLAWLISICFKAFGKDPQLINNERAINKKITQLKKDLEDPHLSSDDKEKLKKEYALLTTLRRHPERLGSGFQEKTSNQG